MPKQSARKTAYQILLPVLKDGMLLNAAFRKQENRFESLSMQDRRFIRRLSKGVLEKKTALDAVLSRLLSKPLSSQNPKLLTVLEMGIYELYFMRTEAYAAVNEYTALSRQIGLQGLKGLVNSVLRNAAEKHESLLSKLSRSDLAGITGWLFQKLKAWYPDKYMTVVENLITPDRPLTVRRMISRVSEEAFLKSLEEDGVTAEKRNDAKNTWILSGFSDLTELKAFREGWFYVQDASSVLAGDMVEDLIRNTPEDRKTAVLDVCAAPGGKTFRLADEALNSAKFRAVKEAAANRRAVDLVNCTEQQLKMLVSGNYRFVSCDVSEEKVRLIEENAERLKLPFIEARVRDASVYCPEFDDAFDLVIADVPCSGIGIIGEKPDIQLHLSDESLASLVRLQEKILDQTACYVKKGGTLAYSTCTLNPDENTEQVRRFIDRHPDFELVFERTCLPGFDDMRGFYMARLCKALS